ncbi:olfactomedin-4-like [Dendropsophus ebraccatus]|uniref:olfactomedin-4-like n=1 Tax=Dendropsophus ebraccatus TaxID=150705 RepID=UPI00383216A8
MLSIEGKKDTMFIFVILLLGFCQNHAASLTHTFEGSTDELGICHCSVVLPDSTFPADRFEMLEISNRNLSITVQKEITKIQHYESTLIIYMEQLINLTKRVEVLEMGGSYTELDFELVKLEIKEMEALILQLKNSMNSTNIVVETLYLEIRNISIMVNQLEVYDKNNVLVIRREIAALKKRLEDCEKNETRPQPPLPPTNYGKCDHGEIVNISKPFVVQLNYLGGSYRMGGWGSDTRLGADQGRHWVAMIQTDNRMIYSIRIFNSYDDLLIYKTKEEKELRTRNAYGEYFYTNCGQGGGMAVYNNSLYYNCYNTQNLCKLNIQTATVDRKVLPDAAYNNRFTYSSSAWQDIDFATDEESLWVLYTTEADGGNIRIGKLDDTTLELVQTWATTQFKRGVTNAFMVCGVLYATRTLSTSKEEIFYMYDTKTSKEAYLSVPYDKVQENVHSLNYNPNNHKLYMFNDGYLVSYDLTFKPLK